jgi:hypothetical protein
MWVIGKKPKGDFAKLMAAVCVRSGAIEGFHDGTWPVTIAGDYSDVKVVDATGAEIPWNQVSHINHDEMKTLMSDVANRIYTFLLRTVFSRSPSDDNQFWRRLILIAAPWSKALDEPKKLDDFLLLYPATSKAIVRRAKAMHREEASANSPSRHDSNGAETHLARH